MKTNPFEPQHLEGTQPCLDCGAVPSLRDDKRSGFVQHEATCEWLRFMQGHEANDQPDEDFPGRDEYRTALFEGRELLGSYCVRCEEHVLIVEWGSSRGFQDGNVHWMNLACGHQDVDMSDDTLRD